MEEKFKRDRLRFSTKLRKRLLALLLRHRSNRGRLWEVGRTSGQGDGATEFLGKGWQLPPGGARASTIVCREGHSPGVHLKKGRREKFELRTVISWESESRHGDAAEDGLDYQA